eukprot:jgi/Mesen1/7145/ME000037S06508
MLGIKIQALSLRSYFPVNFTVTDEPHQALLCRHLFRGKASCSKKRWNMSHFASIGSTARSEKGIVCMAGSHKSGEEYIFESIPTLRVNIDLATPTLQSSDRKKLNNTADSDFYARPRFVRHTDDAFVEKLKALYQEHLKDGMRVLDLMSSWTSHLPEGLTLRHLEGHGLNEAELLANKSLSSFFVQDLNVSQRLPLGDGTFNAALCCVSVQYLQYPEQVFRELHRVLAPGGVLIISFRRADLLTGLLREAGFDLCTSLLPPQHLAEAAPNTEPRAELEPEMGPQTEPSQGRATQQEPLPASISDPFCAIVVTKGPAHSCTHPGRLPPAFASLPAVDSWEGHAGDAAKYMSLASGTLAEAGPPPFGQGSSSAYSAPHGHKNDDVSGSSGASQAASLPPDGSGADQQGRQESQRESQRESQPGQPEEEVSQRVLDRWVAAYRVMQGEARDLGIPQRAIPEIQEPVTAGGVREARDLLMGIIESRMSSNL